MTTIAEAIRAALLETDPRAKVMRTRTLVRDWRKGAYGSQFNVPMPDEPGRPARPELLSPGQMPKRRKAGSERGRIALWHALAHIEFVAIDLALDVAGRFGEQMGKAFVDDFLKVAAEEAMHFALIERHLRGMGSQYGALPAHGGLWEAAYETRHDVAARLAVVPMALEARGLDVTPAMLERARAMGDLRGARILERILDDEITHVRTGTKHFVALAGNQTDSAATLWKTLVQRHFKGSVKPPFNDSARSKAGLSRQFYSAVDC